MTERPTTARPTSLLWILSIWLGVGLIDASQTVFPMRAQGMHHAWVLLFITLVASWLPWAIATPLVMRLARRYPFGRKPLVATALIHLSAFVIIHVVCSAWFAFLETWLDPWLESPPPNSFAIHWFARSAYFLLTTLVVYTVVLVSTAVLDSRARINRQETRAAQLGEQLSKAQLDALRRQMDPHFLFNALNAIAGLVRDNRNEAAVTMIVGLSDFLRRAAAEATAPRVALTLELEHLQHYLEVQKARFEERLRVHVDVPQDISTALVPSLLLQPLVENAIVHGITQLAQGGEIQIVGSRSKNELHLRIRNDGPSLQAAEVGSRVGIALANLRARLQILYGAAFELTLRNADAGGVEVRVSLPFEEA